jgi:hypothetical protein
MEGPLNKMRPIATPAMRFAKNRNLTLQRVEGGCLGVEAKDPTVIQALGSEVRTTAHARAQHDPPRQHERIPPRRRDAASQP